MTCDILWLSLLYNMHAVNTSFNQIWLVHENIDEMGTIYLGAPVAHWGSNEVATILH